MLELDGITFTLPPRSGGHTLLEDISLTIPPGSFVAVIGPSGCGKSTLLKVISGIEEESSGRLLWQGQQIGHDVDFEFTEIGYVPQFSIAYESLTVSENVQSCLRIRTAESAHHAAIEEQVLAATGLTDLSDRPVRVLSGGQRRRLSLAMELVTNPALLLCDEVTSGLDPNSEDELVRLMSDLARSGGRTVMNVTHSLQNLELYDLVIVLKDGRLTFAGSPQTLTHYFSVDDSTQIYQQLARQEAGVWADSWSQHRQHYTPAADPSATQEKPSSSTKLPSAARQFSALLSRRWKLFLRDKSQPILQLAILIGFPCLVALFQWSGIEPLRRLSEQLPDSLAAYEKDLASTTFNINLAGIVSGLVMFQVILLTLIASNNGAREIAGERLIFEKEKLGGLRPSAYVGSKVIFVLTLILAQSFWMAFFVQQTCRLPIESFGAHLLLLFLVNLAVTQISLGISALAKSGDQASLLSVYWVGFQLPLSGAVLALPDWATWVARPFISAYWAWAGGVDGMLPSYLRFIKETTATWIAPAGVSAAVLLMHFFIGLILCFVGVSRNRWPH